MLCINGASFNRVGGALALSWESAGGAQKVGFFSLAGPHKFAYDWALEKIFKCTIVIVPERQGSKVLQGRRKKKVQKLFMTQTSGVWGGLGEAVQAGEGYSPVTSPCWSRQALRRGWLGKALEDNATQYDVMFKKYSEGTGFRKRIGSNTCKTKRKVSRHGENLLTKSSCPEEFLWGRQKSIGSNYLLWEMRAVEG